MRKIIEFLKWFMYIMTCVLSVCAVNMEIYDTNVIPVDTLWQILLAGLITAAATTVFLGAGDFDNRPITVVKMLIHYVVLCVVTVLCGSRFGWMELVPSDIVMMNPIRCRRVFAGVSVRLLH